MSARCAAPSQFPRRMSSKRRPETWYFSGARPAIASMPRVRFGGLPSKLQPSPPSAPRSMRGARSRRCAGTRSKTPGGSLMWQSAEMIRVMPGLPPRGAASPRDVEPLRSAQAQRVAPLEAVPRGAQAGEAVEERADPDRRLDACEARAEAVVGAEGEREVVRDLAREIEAVRVAEALGVAVHRAEEEVDHRCARNDHARDLRVVEHHAVVHLHRAVVAQELLDGVRGELRALAQKPQLVRVAEERDLGVAEQVLGRLVARLEQEDAVRDELGVAE